MGVASRPPSADQVEKFRARVALKPPADEEVKCDPAYVPGDPVALRGIPLVGVQGAGGVIRGTRPGDSAKRLVRDEAFLRRRPPKRPAA